MKIAILGAGAMGSLVGAFLSEGGQDVILINRNAEHMRAVSRKGLHMTINGEPKTVRLNTAETTSGLGAADAVVCLVKTMHTEQAIRGAEELFGSDTYVITLQNGLGNADALRGLFPENKILQGVMNIASRLDGPGRLTCSVLENRTSIHLGTLGAGDEAAVSVAEILAAAWTAGGLKAEYHDNIEPYIWKKAANNIAINSACAIARINVENYCADPYGRPLLEDCLREIIAVARAKGVSLDYDEVIKGIEETSIPIFGRHFPSTAQDVRAKKPTEIDTLNGAISRYGKALGIPTPINDCITALVHVIQDNYENMF